MTTRLNPDIQSSALARFFSATVLKEMALRGSSPTLARLVRESGVEVDPQSKDAVGTLFDQAFKLLKHKIHRHEYIYKAALTQKVLLGTHSLQTASMITEFRVGSCKADVVILNGTGTVYEIKSERDSLSRLRSQIEAYSRVFAKINVILGENHLIAARNIMPDYVGIMLLSNRYQVTTVRDAIEDASRTSSAAIFDAITQRESEMILKLAKFDIPAVPNTQRYSVLRERFVTLEPEFAHMSMVEVLKQSRNLQPLQTLLKAIPKSLYSATITAKLRKCDQIRLLEALQTPIHQAVCWG